MARKSKQSTPIDDARKTIARATKNALKPSKPKKRRRKLTRTQKEARKRARHNAALLKRKGLLGKNVNVRSLKPDSKLRRLFNKFSGVLSGRETTYTLPNDKRLRAILKKEGYTIVGNKIVLRTDLHSRKGKVYKRKPIGVKESTRRRSGVVIDANFEKQVRQFFKGVKDNEGVAFDVFGHSSFSIYQDADALISDVTKYDARAQGKLRDIGLHVVSDPAAYKAERDAARRETERARNRRSNERRKIARAGMRTRREQ